MPVPEGDRIVDHFEIGSDAMAFHRPRAIGLVDTKRWYRHRSAIEQSGAPGDANQATPRSGPNEGAKISSSEQPREHVTARTGQPIDQHAFGSEVTIGG